MRKEIVINSTANEIRIAITEEGKLAELFVETPEKERLVGDIYVGKVAKVMPGIQAAFIDVGLPQDAFLHFSDIGASLGQYNAMLGEDSDIDTEADDEDEESPHPVPPVAAPPSDGTATAVTVQPPPVRTGDRHDHRPRYERQHRNVNLTKGPGNHRSGDEGTCRKEGSPRHNGSFSPRTLSRAPSRLTEKSASQKKSAASKKSGA